MSVETNVRGRDLASFVAEARRVVRKKVPLPEGYSIEWGGQFEQLTSASRSLAIAVPIALLVIYSLLYLNFHSVRLATLILLNVPMAASGGIFALLVRGMPFSVSAGVGFIALFGIAVLNGVVLLSYVQQLETERRNDLARGARWGDDASASGANDGPCCKPRFCTDGAVARRRSGGATAARDSRYRRSYHFHSADVTGVAVDLCLDDGEEGSCGRQKLTGFSGVLCRTSSVGL